MKRNVTVTTAFLLTVSVIICTVVQAQMVTTSTPFNRVGESFHENIGSSWSLQGKNWNMSFGNNDALQGRSQFGNAAGTNSGIQGGVGFSAGNVTGKFWGNMGQGSSRSLVSQTPSVTTFNGVPGMVSDTQQTPFVIGMTPVVGNWDGRSRLIDPTGGSLTGNMNTPISNKAVTAALSRARAAEDSPMAINNPDYVRQAVMGGGHLQRPQATDTNVNLPALDDTPSSAEVAVGSVAQMKQLYEQETLAPMREKAQLNIEKARAAAEKGRIPAAKSYYKTALKYADAETKKVIVQEYNSLLK